MFNKDRLRKRIHDQSNGEAKEIMNAVTEGVKEFRGEAPQEDDITLVVVKAVGGPLSLDGQTG